MIFVDTKRFSPVIYENDLPDPEDYFHKKPEDITNEFIEEGDYFIDRNWWNRQRERCLHGYTVKDAIAPGGDYLVDGKDALWSGKDCYIPSYDLWFKNGEVHISGRYYFYLNFWPIYAVKAGKMSKTATHPKFLALDFFFAERVRMMEEQKKDGEDLKGRQEGFSEKGGGMVLGYNYTFYEDSQNIIVAALDTDADVTLLKAKNGLKFLANTQFYHETSFFNDELVKAKYFGSEIRKVTAKDNPQCLSRFSPFWVWYEEIGKGKKGWSLAVARYNKAAIETEGIKTGFQHFIGTAGQMDEGVYDLEQRFYNPDAYNLISFPNIFDDPTLEVDPKEKVAHFTGKSWYKLIDENGNPRLKESIQAIEDDIMSMPPEERYAERTQFAYYVSHAFASTVEGFFGADRIQSLSRRKMLLRSKKELQIVRRGILKYKDINNPYKGCEFVPDDFGWLKIVEEPETVEVINNNQKTEEVYHNLYWGGADSYDQDEARTSNSKGAFYIRKTYIPNSKNGLYNCFVAQVIERPTVAEGGAERFYEHCAMVCVYYSAMVNIEYSNLRIFQWFEDHNFGSLLMPRPQMALAGRVLNTQVSNRFGTDKSLKPHILAILRDRLTDDYIDRMFFIEQVEALSKFRYDPSGKKYNCDITIATAEAEIAAKEYEFIVVKNPNDKPNKKGILITRMIDGRLQTKVV